MGWSTSVVAPPDGDMGDYMNSLQRLYDRQDRIYYPAHGQPIDRPHLCAA
jgi:glyoxylase-like metal-dependent hydrolase (beta-lactamase superfamily II)